MLRIRILGKKVDNLYNFLTIIFCSNTRFIFQSYKDWRRPFVSIIQYMLNQNTEFQLHSTEFSNNSIQFNQSRSTVLILLSFLYWFWGYNPERCILRRFIKGVYIMQIICSWRNGNYNQVIAGKRENASRKRLNAFPGIGKMYLLCVHEVLTHFM